jgi:hypothetical protein
MVTGPARIAWITMAWCCAFAWLQATPVRAAGPRDAVKTLPRVSHTSDFRVNESDKDNRHTYEDSYYDTWDIHWQPQPIDLPNGQIGFEFRYIKRLSDQLRRHDSVSNDSRYDQYNFTVRLDKLGHVKSHFAIQEADTLSGSFPSDSPRSLSINTRKEAFITWNPPGFPSISAGHVVTNTAGYTGTSRNHSDEVQWTQVRANYRNDLGVANQNVSYVAEYTRSDNFYPAQTGTSNSKQVWDATRNMPLGNIGRLQLDVHFEENSKRQDTQAE